MGLPNGTKGEAVKEKVDIVIYLYASSLLLVCLLVVSCLFLKKQLIFNNLERI